MRGEKEERADINQTNRETWLCRINLTHLGMPTIATCAHLVHMISHPVLQLGSELPVQSLRKRAMAVMYAPAHIIQWT